MKLKREVPAAVILLVTAAGCGPRITTARLITPTPAARFSEPVEPTPTPAAAPATAPAARLSPTSSAPPPPTATPPARTAPPAAIQVPSLAPTRAPAPRPTATRAPSPPPPPTMTRPPEPTATGVPSPFPTRVLSPRPTATLSPAPPPTVTRVPVPPPTATRPPAPITAATRLPAAALPPATSTPSVTVTAVTAARAGGTPAPLVPTAVFDSSALLGDWRFRAETGERDIEGLLRFRLEGGALAGLYVSPNGAATMLTNLEVSGNRIAWELVTPRTTWNLKGTFTDNWMNGTFQTTTRTVQWTATKQSGSAETTPTISPG